MIYHRLLKRVRRMPALLRWSTVKRHLTISSLPSPQQSFSSRYGDSVSWLSGCIPSNLTQIIPIFYSSCDDSLTTGYPGYMISVVTSLIPPPIPDAVTLCLEAILSLVSLPLPQEFLLSIPVKMTLCFPVICGYSLSLPSPL